MEFPKKSNYHITQGTWFVLNENENTIHIHQNNTGEQKIYYNKELVASKRSLKMTCEQDFMINEDSYKVISKPKNLQLTASKTLVLKNDVILKNFIFSYTFGWSRMILFFLWICVVSIPLIIYKAPIWMFATTIVASIFITIYSIRNSLVKIEEQDNPIKIDF